MAQAFLTIRQMLNMAVGFLGIQFAWSIQMGQMSAIYERLGATPEEVSWLWIAGPITGMLVQPIIGNMSDHTWGRLGRRRPYFLTGAILASCVLVLMPNSPVLWMAAALLWIMDASINISMEPFRALVADLAPEGQRGTAYTFQSFAIGLGSVLSFGLGGLVIYDWLISRYGEKGQSIVDTLTPYIPTSTHFLFYVGAVVFMAGILWTIFTTKEYPPEDLAAFNAKEKKTGIFHTFKETWSMILEMPANMKRLCLVHSLTWFSFFCMFIFFSPMVAANIFHAAPNTPEYDHGVAWASLCYLALNLVCFASSPILGMLTKKYKNKTVHGANLLIGGVAMASLFFAKTPAHAMIAMAFIGVTWASTLSLPYAILSSSVPKERYGLFMGAFNIFICIPQIICSLSAGPIVTALGGDKAIALILGGISFILAVIALKWVNEPTPNSTR